MKKILLLALIFTSNYIMPSKSKSGKFECPTKSEYLKNYLPKVFTCIDQKKKNKVTADCEKVSATVTNCGPTYGF